MLPRALIRQKNVLASGIFIAFMMSAVFGAIYYLSIYFQAVKGASAMLSAVYLLPMIVAQLITAALAGAAGKLEARGLYAHLRVHCRY